MSESQKEESIEEKRKKLLESVTDYYPTIPRSAQCKRLGLEEQRREMIFEAFELFDTDHSGSLELGEIKYAMLVLGYPTKADEINRLIEEKGEDGSIDFGIFTDFVLSKMALVPPEEEALRSFRLIDEEHKGFVDAEQLHKVLDPLSGYIDIPEGRLEEIVNSADKDGDGVMSFDEFLKAFLKTMK